MLFSVSAKPSENGWATKQNPRGSEDPARAERVPERWGGGESDRRTFIKRGLLAGGSLLALAGIGARATAQAHLARAKRAGVRRAPNILVILVDQLRAPTWVPASVQLDSARSA